MKEKVNKLEEMGIGGVKMALSPWGCICNK